MCGMSLARAQVEQPAKGKLGFIASGTNGFAFDTGVLKGKLRAGGKSTGLSSVVHLPTGVTLDSSMGLFGHYRLFSTNKRYGTAAWDWPSDARLIECSHDAICVQCKQGGGIVVPKNGREPRDGDIAGIEH